MNKKELLIILLISVLIIGMRVYQIDADPPPGLSSSSDVYTDPPNLTLSAKQDILNNESNQLNQKRYVLFDKSSITVVAQVVYMIMGVSLASSNIVGLLFSLGGLFIFFLITRKAAGNFAGIIFLIFIGLNYNQIFYGRLVFQEHAMIFWGGLAFGLLLYLENKYAAFTAGISLGLAIFFGKIIGIVFIGPFLVYFLYEIYSQKKPGSKTNGIYFFSGFILLTIIWGMFVFLPAQGEISTYVGEQVVNNHGFPAAFQSVSKFIDQFITLGLSSNLLSRMVIVSLFAMIYIVIGLYNFIPSRKKSAAKIQPDSSHLFIITLTISYYLFLMVWDYRPLRYQLVLIYPLCVLAAIYISNIIKSQKMIIGEKISPLLFYLMLPFTVIFLSYIMFEFKDSIMEIYSSATIRIMILTGMILISWMIFLVIKLWLKWESPLKQTISKTIVIVSLLLVVGLNGYRYVNWVVRPIFSIRDSSLDFKTILSPEAFITGSHSSTLTVETNYNSMIHMFGVSNPDPDFFKKYPITHLLIDKNNEERARKDYPQIMNQAKYVLSYNLGLSKVILYRVAGHTKNPTADKYELSTFEQAVSAYENKSFGQFERLTNQFMNENPENITGSVLAGIYAKGRKNYNRYESLLENAIEFSPTNYTLIRLLANHYHEQFLKTKNPEYKAKGLKYYDQVIWLSPPVVGLNDERDKLNESN